MCFSELRTFSVIPQVYLGSDHVFLFRFQHQVSIPYRDKRRLNYPKSQYFEKQDRNLELLVFVILVFPIEKIVVAQIHTKRH